MKIHKLSIFVLILILLISNTAFASMEDKLTGHWAKDTINKEFLSYYFPYFARDNFNLFQPDNPMSRDGLALSTSSLFKAKGYTVSGMETRGEITRKEMLIIIGSRLKKIGITPDPNHKLDFVDIQGLTEEAKDYLKILNKEKIILGVGGASFGGDKKLSQAEAVVILQRVESFLNRLNKINFITKSVESSYNNKEEIITTIGDTDVVLAITKQFPNPGYTLSVKEVLKQGDKFKVYLESKKPPADSIQLQVITFKTIQIQMQKSDLGGGPYNFVVDGFIE